MVVGSLLTAVALLIVGAVRYLRWLEETYWNEAIPDSTERVKFILASYNAGAGHVMDAQRLTEYHDGDPTVWEDVAFWLLQKSEQAVYTHPVVRHGYCRGLEPVTYVSLILSRYDHYRQFVVEQPDAGDGINEDALEAIDPLPTTPL